MVSKSYDADVLNQNCPSRLVLELISDKWTVLVIHGLQFQTVRFLELQRRIQGVSQKMLTQTLRKMEREGLIKRTVYPTVPLAVEYSLTELGESLITPLEALCEWAEKHLFLASPQAAYSAHKHEREHQPLPGDHRLA